jgi:membrane fusion protein, multidrug efflux system
LSADLNDKPVVGPDRQLPEYGGARAERQLPPASPAHRGSMGCFLLVFVLLLAGIGFFLFHHHEEEKKAAAAHHTVAAVPITTGTAKKGDIGIYLDAIGTVTPVYTDSMTSEVDGLVTAVHFVEGQRVKKGDPLIDIDSRPYTASLLQAQGALERDQNVLAEAQMDLTRYQAALARNAIAKQIVDDQEKLVKQDEGTVKNDEGTVQYDQVQVDFCSITAPISGRMGLRLIDPGNYVQSSGATTLAVITQMEPITVIFTIPEDSLGSVITRLNQHAKLPVDAYDRSGQNKIESGMLMTVDNQIDTTTGTVKGRAVYPNKNDVLFPNQFVNTRLLVNTLQGVTLVPASAIQQNGQDSFVYIIQNDTAYEKSVKPGVTDAGMTEVTGINPGDVVATSTFDKLQDKTKVTIANNTNAVTERPMTNPGSPGNHGATQRKTAKGSSPQ